MEEHFNENYMDSDKFPKAVFRGKLSNFDVSSLSGEQEYDLSGSLTVRGVKKDINTKATIKAAMEKAKFCNSDNQMAIKPSTSNILKILLTEWAPFLKKVIFSSQYLKICFCFGR